MNQVRLNQGDIDLKLILLTTPPPSTCNCLHTHTPTHKYTYTHTQVHIHPHTSTHTPTHKYTYTYTLTTPTFLHTFMATLMHHEQDTYTYILIFEMFISTLMGNRKHPKSLGVSVGHSNPFKCVKIHPMHGAAKHLMLSDKFIRVLISTPFLTVSSQLYTQLSSLAIQPSEYAHGSTCTASRWAAGSLSQIARDT